MSKANKVSQHTTTPARPDDAELLAMIRRHGKLWTEWDRIANINEEDPRISTFSREAVELERKILATPALTRKGLAGKRRVVQRAEMEAWDDLGIIETIFDIDAERVATGERTTSTMPAETA
jgi:hypothetical protein